MRPKLGSILSEIGSTVGANIPSPRVKRRPTPADRDGQGVPSPHSATTGPLAPTPNAVYQRARPGFESAFRVGHQRR